MPVAAITTIDAEKLNNVIKELKKMPSDTKFPVSSATVCLVYRGKDDKENEVVHTVDGEVVEIVSCTHDIKKKMRAAKDEEGNVIGFEPTGEEELVLKVKYIRNP